MEKTRDRQSSRAYVLNGADRCPLGGVPVAVSARGMEYHPATAYVRRHLPESLSHVAFLFRIYFRGVEYTMGLRFVAHGRGNVLLDALPTMERRATVMRRSCARVP